MLLFWMGLEFLLFLHLWGCGCEDAPNIPKLSSFIISTKTDRSSPRRQKKVRIRWLLWLFLASGIKVVLINVVFLCFILRKLNSCFDETILYYCEVEALKFHFIIKGDERVTGIHSVCFVLKLLLIESEKSTKRKFWSTWSLCFKP